MTTVESARNSLHHAQSLLELVERDNERFVEVLAWLAEAVDRSAELDTYYRGPGQQHIDMVLAADPEGEGVVPSVAGEDAVWEATTVSHDNLLRMLRQVSAALTATLDDRA